MMGFGDVVASAHHSIFTGRMIFLMPNQQCQSTEGKYSRYSHYSLKDGSNAASG